MHVVKAVRCNFFFVDVVWCKSLMWFQWRCWCFLHCLCLSHFSSCQLLMQPTCFAFWLSAVFCFFFITASVQYVLSVGANKVDVLMWEIKPIISQGLDCLVDVWESSRGFLFLFLPVALLIPMLYKLGYPIGAQLFMSQQSPTSGKGLWIQLRAK